MRSLARLALLALFVAGVRLALRKAAPVSRATVGYVDGSTVELPPGSPLEQELAGIAATVLQA